MDSVILAFDLQTAMSRPSYIEFLPPAKHQRWLVCFWHQETAEGAGEHCQRVLPDGCIDMVWIGDAAPVLAGPATTFQMVALPAGARVTGMRFRPGAAAHVLGLPADVLLNLHVPVAEVSHGLCPRLAELRFDEREAVPLRLARLLAALEYRLGQVCTPDALVLSATEWLAVHPEGRIDVLARAVGLDRRQLHRRFCADVGYSPKTFQRVMRFQRLLHIAGGAGGPGQLVQLASAAGYADQAHMCREVQAFSGQTPQTLLARSGSTLELADLFNTA